MLEASYTVPFGLCGQRIFIAQSLYLRAIFAYLLPLQIDNSLEYTRDLGFLRIDSFWILLSNKTQSINKNKYNK